MINIKRAKEKGARVKANPQSEHFKRAVLALAINLLFGTASVYANPTDATIINGTVGIDTSIPGVTNITNSPNAIINWQGFSIGQNEITRFIQQSGQSTVLNRVVGGNPSQIMGQLLSNGHVYLINPNGLLFGAGSVVDTAGFLGSSLNLSNNDFLSGNFHFIAGADAGDINNEGIIRTGQDGNIVLIAPNIENSGIISTEGGRITLAAGEQLTLTSLDDPRIRFEIQAPDNAILNVGEVLANGGAIDLFAGTITHSGEINANSVEVDDQGQIWLVAKDDITLSIGSKVTANNSAGNGGDIVIETLGFPVVDGEASINQANIYQQGLVQANGVQGGTITIYADSLLSSSKIEANGDLLGGDVHVSLANRLLATQYSIFSANASDGDGGVIDVRAGDRIFSSAEYSATGGVGGGRVVLTASEIKLVDAAVNVNGDTQGGTIRIGGGFQGNEPNINNADNTYINVTTALTADAITAGNGGSVVVWAENSTSFGGAISARGGSESGDGGSAEVSGKGVLGYNGFVDLTALNGRAGTLLLDPTNLTVFQGSGSNLSADSTELLDPNPGVGDFFGDNFTLLDNDFYAIGQPTDDFGGTDAGAFYVFNDATGALAYALMGSFASDRLGENITTNLLSVGTNKYVLLTPAFNSDRGAVSWFDSTAGISGALSGTNSLVGTLAGDMFGADGIEYVSGGYVIKSHSWGSNQGAWTWFDPATGTLANAAAMTGTLTTFNSLLGGFGGDTQPSSTNLVNLGANLWVLIVERWDDTGAQNDKGAALVFDGALGEFLDESQFVGNIFSGNALVGLAPGDRIGNGGIEPVGDGILIFSSLYGDQQGAWTWFNPLTGLMADGSIFLEGVLTSTNSLVGGSGGDTFASYSFSQVLTGDRYALLMPQWDAPGGPFISNVGAMTILEGSTGKFLDGTDFVGIVSSSNSLVGSTLNDRLGSSGLTSFGSGIYVLQSPLWQDDAGAITWFDATNNLLADGVSPINSVVSDLNSLVGSTPGDQLGSWGLNWVGGAYIVNSPSWGGKQGAWTWFDPIAGELATGAAVAGVVSDSNSLVGGTPGSFASVTIQWLTGSNYALINSLWDASGTVDAGAVTLFDGASGTFLGGPPIVGTISGSNSLVGSSAFDQVGGNWLEDVGGGYIVNSPFWGGNQGAWTWFDPVAGLMANGDPFAGVVSDSNSLVGGTPGTFTVATIQWLTGSNYALINSSWDASGAVDAGAVTLFDGANGIFPGGGDLVGAINSSNSLVGNSPGDQVGSNWLEYVGGGYLVNSPSWGGNQGAWTWFDPITGELATGAGFAGEVSALNSLVGGTGGDDSGSFGETQSLGGNYVLFNSEWDAPGPEFDAGAVTLFDGANGIFLGGGDLVGAINSSNSLVGSSAGDRVGAAWPQYVGGGYLLTSTYWNVGEGAWTWFDPVTGLLANGQAFKGAVSASNSLVGGTSGDTSSSFALIQSLGSGTYALINDEWDAPGPEFDAGAVTLFDGATGTFLVGGDLVGVISSSNSLVGDSAGDQVGSWGLEWVGGGYLVMSPNWGSNQGAWTWFDPVTGLLANGDPFAGAVSALNSLVGGTGGDGGGSDGFTQFLSGIGNTFALVNFLWDAPGALFNVGAVTLFDGVSGTFHTALGGGDLVGTINSSNSLVGSSAGDLVGESGLYPVSGAYIVNSPDWGFNQGAWTWFDPVTGLLANGDPFVGEVSDLNSIVGGTPGGFASVSIQNLTGSNYALINSGWDAFGAVDAGAVTLFDGAAGTFLSGAPLVGEISGSNSLVGDSAGDQVGIFLQSVGGGYMVYNPYWGGNQGAWTWFDPVTGLLANGNPFAGAVSDLNSLVGGTGGDISGSFAFATSLGSSVHSFINEGWDAVSVVDAGFFTFFDGATGAFLDGAPMIGTVSSGNSFVGAATGDMYNSDYFEISFGSRYAFFVPLFDNVGGVDSGLVTVVDFVTSPETPTSDVLFGDSLGSDINVSSTAIKLTLDMGTNLLLQANNDITINGSIIVDEGGGGGNLTLQGGRSILINADIFTDNGDFAAFANTGTGTGTVDLYREAGAASIIMADGVSINAGTGNIQLWIGEGNGLTEFTSGDIIVETLIAQHILFKHNGLTSGGSILGASADHLIIADSLFIDDDGPANGSIGTSLMPLRVSLINLGAHIHGTGAAGIYIQSLADISIGNSFFGDGHLITGLETVDGGDLYLDATGFDIALEDIVRTVNDDNITFAANQITVNGDILDAGLGTIDFGASLLLLGADQTMESTVIIDRLTLVAGNDFILNSGAQINGAITVSGGLLGGTGDVNILGALSITGGATITGTGLLITQGTTDINLLGANDFVALTGGRTWLNTGVLTIGDDDFINFGFGSGGSNTLSNIGFGVLNLNTSYATPLSTASGTSTFDNVGTLNQTIVGTHAIDVTTFTNNGSINVLTGTLDLNGAAVSIATGKYLRGNGTIIADVTNSGGSIQPGGAGTIGTLTIDGTLTNTSGTVEIDILNNVDVAGVGYDLLATTGNGTFGGDLTLMATGVYTVTDGDSFDPITCDVLCAGSFAINPIIGSTAAQTTNANNLNILLSLSLLVAGFWDGGGDGLNWFDPDNWSLDILPGELDDVVINVAGPGVNFDGGTVTINSLETSDPLTLNSGGLTINDIATADLLTLSGGTLTLNADSSIDTFNLNGGELAVANEATLTIDSEFDWNSGRYLGPGILDLTAGLVDFVSGTQSGGMIKLPAGFALDNTDSLVLTGGTLIYAGGPTMVLGANTSLTIDGGTFTSDAPVTGNGSLTFASGTLDISSTVDGTGTFNLDGGFLTGTGSIDLTNGAFLNGSGATLNGPTLSVGANQPGDFTGVNVQSGTYNVLGNASLLAGETLNITGGIVNLEGLDINGGILNWSGGTINLTNAMTISSTGTFSISGDNNITAPSFTNNGLLQKIGGTGTSLFVAATFDNTGTILAQSGTLSFGPDLNQTAGLTELDGGSIIASTFIFDGGLLSGSGTLIGDVTNNATIAPGFSPGTINISGNYLQTSSGTLNMELQGTNPGEYDQLVVSGTATLDGTLNLNILSPYDSDASVGDSFDLITASSITDNGMVVMAPAGFSFDTGFLSGIYNALLSSLGTDNTVIQDALVTQPSEVVILTEQSTLEVVDEEPLIEEVVEEETVADAEATTEETGTIEPIPDDQAIGACT